MNHIVLTLVFLLPATSGCYIGNWYYLSPRKKYVMYHQIHLSWVDAKVYCEGQGGQLLVIPNERTNDKMTGTDKDENYQYPNYIGLSNIDSEKFQWVDGTPVEFVKLTCQEYTNWDTGQPEESEDPICVGHLAWEGGPWKGYACSEALYHFCEAKKPCAPRPVLSFNNGSRLEDEEVTIIDPPYTIDVKCFLRGYAKNVESVRIQCESDTEIDESIVGRELTKTISLDVNTYHVTCTCISKSLEAKVYKSESRMNINRRPRFVNPKMRIPEVIFSKKGKVLELSFDISAIPVLKSFNISRADNLMDGGDTYKLDITPPQNNECFTTTVKFIMNTLFRNQSGIYNISVTNGIGNLDFSLNLDVIEDIICSPFPSPGPAGLADYIVLALILVSIVLCPLICNVPGVFSTCKRRASETKKKSVYDDRTSSGVREEDMRFSYAIQTWERREQRLREARMDPQNEIGSMV